jgi:hypothetical protein
LAGTQIQWKFLHAEKKWHYELDCLIVFCA